MRARTNNNKLKVDESQKNNSIQDADYSNRNPIVVSKRVSIESGITFRLELHNNFDQNNFCLKFQAQLEIEKIQENSGF